jgi:replicative DNA helicase
MPRKITPIKKAPTSVTKAQEGGDRIAVLEALASKIATAIDESSSGRDIAALSKQLRDTLNEIDRAHEQSATVPDVVGLALKNRREKC